MARSLSAGHNSAGALRELCGVTTTRARVCSSGSPLVAVLAAGTPEAADFGGRFGHVGTFDVPAKLLPAEPQDTITSAEIIARVPGGRTLVYTDSLARRLGFVDIARAHAPTAAAVLDLGGEPTSVATTGIWALVAVNPGDRFRPRDQDPSASGASGQARDAERRWIT